MPASRPSAQRRALRAMAEGARPSVPLLADAANRSLASLRREAERDGWRLDRPLIGDVLERIRILANMLLERLEEVTRAALEGGGRIDKAEIEAIISLTRSLEKIVEITRPEEAARDNQIAQDEELAAMLQAINDKIIELAWEIAREILEQDGGDGGRAALRRPVAP
jgi:hypothetical protein